MYQLEKLIDDGYEVTFQHGEHGYEAYLVTPDGNGITATGATPGAALWAASPLHDDDEPYPGDSDAERLAHVAKGIYITVKTIEALATEFHGYGAEAGYKEATRDGIASLVERLDQLETMLSAPAPGSAFTDRERLASLEIWADKAQMRLTALESAD